jgi:transcriptional regulator with XRE-family HTH domain
MSITDMPAKTAHHGKNIKRLRETLQIKQEALADTLGISQQKVSALEQKEKIDREQMEQIAKALNIPADLIEHYDPEASMNIISNHFTSKDNSTFNSNSNSNAHGNNNSTLNTIDELLKAFEENKKLYQELLRVEREKVEMLEKMLNK